MTDSLAGKLPMGDGRRALVEQIYRRHWAELCRYARRAFGAGPPEPEEVAQAAFARFAGLDRPDEVAHPRAFLYQCARNVVLDQRRRDAVRARADGEVQALSGCDGPVVLDAERVLSGKERLQIVEAAIRVMEAKRRRVLVMHAIHGLGYSEIARREGLSPTRVTQLVASAVAECERALRFAEGADSEGGGR
jgi:RNA polymerase sigma-70 factor (ECF subfamily)